MKTLHLICISLLLIGVTHCAYAEEQRKARVYTVYMPIPDEKWDKMMEGKQVCFAKYGCSQDI